MKRPGARHEAISRIVFDQCCAVATDQRAQQPSGELSRGMAFATVAADSMASACPIPVLESMCICALQPFIDARVETIVGALLECRPCAPIAPGAALRVSGWVEYVNDDDAVKFHVQVQDEQERVCEASITLAIVGRESVDRHIARKREAIARRELFRAA